jgi:hypothetical protein
MYIIQIDNRYWFVDSGNGWLKTTLSPQRAAMFSSQEDAHEVAEMLCKSSSFPRQYSVLMLG